MTDLLRLCRLYYAAPMSLAYTLTVYYARGGQMTGQWVGVAISTAALLLVIAAGYVINDVVDVTVDRINSPDRPVASGQVARKLAAAWGLALLAAGLTLAGLGLPGRWAFLATLAAVAAGLMFYDLFSKRLGPGKQLLAAGLMTSIYPLAVAFSGGATGPRAWSLAVFPGWMFLTAFGYETLKDIRDVTGDRASGGRVTLIQRNPGTWRRIAAGLLIAGSLLLIGPALLGCRWVYMAVAALAIAAAVGAAFVPVRRAIQFVYVECVIVGLAATADVIVFGV